METGRLSVYLVEDSPILVGLLTRVLSEDAGATIVGTSGDANTGIAHLEQLAPSVAVIDLLLHSSTGFDVLRAVTQRLPQTVPLVLTGLASDAHREAARKLGVPDEHLFDKSSGIAKLVALVQKLGMVGRPSVS